MKANSWKQEQGRCSERIKAVEFEVMAIGSINSRISKLIKNRNEKEENQKWNLKERIACSRKSEKKDDVFGGWVRESEIRYEED